MYLQITTKCNMTCAHCCYNCTMRGKHADYNTVIDMISFARNYTENITIGGGEPTLHPRFFDILKHCLDDFDYVWMATNGSQTDTMFRLANIIQGEDYQDCNCSEEDQENGYCEWQENSIYQENKLTVALSQDHFHDEINQRVIDLWTRNARQHKHTGFEIRDVSSHVIAEGRAKKTSSGWEEGCICSDIIIKPDGKIKLCGCINSPVIGDIWSGITDKGQKMLNNEKYQEINCYKSLKRR